MIQPRLVRGPIAFFRLSTGTWAPLWLGHLRKWVELSQFLVWVMVSLQLRLCTLSRLGLPGWFTRTYFAYHSQVRLGLKLTAGFGESWCRDGSIPQGCPLSMVFIVALYVPWCRYRESVTDVKPQLYADNLKCSAQCRNALFDAARFTARYVRAAGQDVSPGKCVLLSSSKSVRKAVKLWDISGDGRFWKV